MKTTILAIAIQINSAICVLAFALAIVFVLLGESQNAHGALFASIVAGLLSKFFMVWAHHSVTPRNVHNS